MISIEYHAGSFGAKAILMNINGHGSHPRYGKIEGRNRVSENKDQIITFHDVRKVFLTVCICITVVLAYPVIIYYLPISTNVLVKFHNKKDLHLKRKPIMQKK